MENVELTPVGQWLVEQCRARHLSWREASIGAGVDKGTVSAIIRGLQPGLEVCKGLAAYFGVSTEYMLRLAGHLAQEPTALPPEVDVMLHELEGLPEPLQRAAVAAWRAVLEGLQVARQMGARGRGDGETRGRGDGETR